MVGKPTHILLLCIGSFKGMPQHFSSVTLEISDCPRSGAQLAYRPVTGRIQSSDLGEANPNEVRDYTESLRLGHTYLTHKYLLSRDKIVPQCDTCSVRLTVRHILLDCPKFQRFRRPIIKFVSSLQLPLSLSVLLGDDHPFLLKIVFKFLDDAELSDLIC